jgi:LacI family transcriptional regulator
MKSAVTQNDVAREAGVTRSMVSYVISGNSDRSVAQETRQRILDAIDRLGYRPNRAAQVLQQGDVAYASNKIGVILCSEQAFLRPYYTEIISGIHTAAHTRNFQVNFIRFFYELKNPVLFNNLIHEEEIGGLILIAVDQCMKTQEDFDIMEKIKKRLQKIVCVEFQYEGLSCVMFDRRETSAKAAECVLEKGFADTIYIGPNDERVEGIQFALSKFGRDPSLEKFFAGEAVDMKGGFSAAQSVLQKGKIPRSIICGSDEVAVGVLSALNKHAIKIPSQVAVVSIDNVEGSEFTCPPLTTMNIQKKAMGERAVEMIVNGTAEKDEKAIKVVLPSTLVVRESC